MKQNGHDGETKHPEEENGHDRDAKRLEKESDDAYVCRAKAYFKVLVLAEKRLAIQSFYRKRLQSMAEGSAGRSPETVSGGNQTGKEDILARLTDLDREMEQEAEHLRIMRKDTWVLLSLLSHPKAGLVLEEFYLNGTSVSTIAHRIGYNERHTYRLRHKALREFGKLLADHGIERENGQKD